MLVTEEMISTAIISVVLGFGGGYFTYRITVESRLKDLEHEVKLLEPIKNAVLKLGSKQVEKVFDQGEK